MKIRPFSLFALLLLSISSLGQRSNGLLFADEEDYIHIQKASIRLLQNVPDHYDLSKWFPEPGDQGNQASCVGWALGYGIKTYQEARRLNRPPSSVEHVFSPSFIYNQISSNCYEGSNIREALELMRTKGVAPMLSFPYDYNDCHKNPSNQIQAEAKQFTISDWKRVEFRNEGLMKSFIASGKPVVIGFETDEWFDNLKENEVYRVSSHRSTGGHAVVVIGYDDRRKAYRILNSWGTEWGDHGYGWIAYSLFDDVVHEAYVLDVTKQRSPTAKRKQK